MLLHDPLRSKKALASQVLAWYRRNGRNLPWRQTRDPYRIWVSEVMLQQTRVATVLPYYDRFLEAFPTIYHLARANEDEVLRVWEGMGYYGRARNLFRAAQSIVEQHRGKLPRTREGLLSLPGIGANTAAAILSFAYGHPSPILDANVQRILSRLFLVEDNPGSTATQHLLWQLSEGILPRPSAACFNQGLMDIGSLVCTPRNPQCGTCPLSRFCGAFQRGVVHRMPPPRKAGPLPYRERFVAVIFREDRVLIRRRPSSGLLGGLWEFPGTYQENGASPFELLPEYLCREHGLSIELEQEVLAFHHSYTHFRESIRVFFGIHRDRKKVSGRHLCWVLPCECVEFPFSASHRRISEALKRATESGNWEGWGREKESGKELP